MWHRMNQAVQTILLKLVLGAVAFDRLRPLCRFNAGTIPLRCFVNGGLLVLMLCAVYGASRAARVVGVKSNCPAWTLAARGRQFRIKQPETTLKRVSTSSGAN